MLPLGATPPRLIIILLIFDSTAKLFFLKVGSAYGRKTMKGYLASKGIHVGENRVGKSLRRVDPSNHIRRTTLTYFQTNPTSCTAAYFGEKVHIDQI